MKGTRKLNKRRKGLCDVTAPSASFSLSLSLEITFPLRKKKETCFKASQIGHKF